MNKQEAIEWLEQIKDIYIRGGDEDFDGRRKEAIDMAIEALSDPHNCAGCKYEEMWSEACEKCSRPMVDNYVKGIER